MSFLLGYIDYKVSNIIKFVFSVALPTKKHLSDEQSESARRGELTKSLILSSGDKRASPQSGASLVKQSFTSDYKKANVPHACLFYIKAYS